MPLICSTGRRLKILLSEGSSITSRLALYGVGRGHTIDLVASSRLCQSRFSRLVRRVHLGPPFSRDPLGYLEKLKELVSDERYDVLLPTHEQTYLLSRVRDQFDGIVGLAVPDFAAMERMQTKTEFIRLLDELGLPYPSARVVSTRDELERETELPCFVKTPFGTAGNGVHRVENREQLLAVAALLEAASVLDGRQETLVQQPARGTQAQMSTVFQHGRLVAWHAFEAREIGVGGSAIALVGANHPLVAEQIAQLGKHIAWHGAAFFDYFIDPATGRAEYIEANPRLGASISAMKSGVDLCGQLIRVSLGEEVDPLPSPRPGVRTHQGFVIQISRALAGATRRRLCVETWRRWRGAGLYESSEDEFTRLGDDWLSLLPELGIQALLLAWPGAAQRLVSKTVADYSLTAAAARQIRGL
jgi:predicted ATP-grasp superfamily ATP-dependent carboligase